MSPKAKMVWTLLIVGVLTLPFWYWLVRQSSQQRPVDRPVSAKTTTVDDGRPMQDPVPVPARRELPDPDRFGRKIVTRYYRGIELPVVATEYVRDKDSGWVGIVAEVRFERRDLGEKLPLRSEIRAHLESALAAEFTLSGFPGVTAKNAKGEHVRVWHSDGSTFNLWHLHRHDYAECGACTLRFFLRPFRSIPQERLQEIREHLENESSWYRFRVFLLLPEEWMD